MTSGGSRRDDGSGVPGSSARASSRSPGSDRARAVAAVLRPPLPAAVTVTSVAWPPSASAAMLSADSSVTAAASTA